VLLLGRFYGGVNLPVWQFLVIAVTIWFGATIFAALAVAIGYRYQPDQVQPIAIAVYFVFAILGGLLFPISGGLQKVGEFTPTYDAVKIATDVIRDVSVSVGLVAGLAVWLLIFIGLATLSVRATAESV
jgi:ABC-2 type transport system permease protein